MKTQDGRLYVISGASRSGKTAWTRKQTAKKRRIAAWDPEDQWSQLPGWKKITNRAALLEAMKKPGAFKLAYVAGGDLKAEFDFFCGCCMYAGRYVEGLDVVAEELADVTTPSKAPGNWGILLRRGLKRGITIWAISQRWAEADKTAVGNATDFSLFRASAEDARYLQRKTGVLETEIASMVQLEYILKDALTGAIQRGKLKF